MSGAVFAQETAGRRLADRTEDDPGVLWAGAPAFWPPRVSPIPPPRGGRGWKAQPSEPTLPAQGLAPAADPYGAIRRLLGSLRPPPPWGGREGEGTADAFRRQPDRSAVPCQAAALPPAVPRDSVSPVDPYGAVFR